jgi:RNA polymerase primary sigma factor
MGKEHGYLLYAEVNELLPADIATSNQLDELFTAFGHAGIEVVDSEGQSRDRQRQDRRGEGVDDVELDLTPSALDKTNDPVRMYLREMGAVPLLTREGEVAIAKRFERGKRLIFKAVSRTPTTAKAVVQMGERLRSGDRKIRELVTFRDDEVTDTRIERRARDVMAQIETIRKTRLDVVRREKKVRTIHKRDTRYRRNYRNLLRARVRLSRLIRSIAFTEPVTRRLVDDVNKSTEEVRRIGHELEHLDRRVKAKTRRRIGQRTRGASRGGNASCGPCSGVGPKSWNNRWRRWSERATRSCVASWGPDARNRNWWRRTCVSWCRSRRNTATAGCSFST